MNTQLPNFIMKRYANEQIVFASKVWLFNSKILNMIIVFVIIFQIVFYVSVNSMINNSQITNAMILIMFFDIVIVLLLFNFVLKGYLIVTQNTVSYEMILWSMKENIQDLEYKMKDNNSLNLNLGKNKSPISICFANNQDLEQFVNTVKNVWNNNK